MSEKEDRIRKMTKLYYSNPLVQRAILKFAKDREVVPQYYESFGKRPDSLQYISDIMGLVNKGATSFHSSEELWENPLEINSDMGPEEMDGIRKGWDLLIDIDSPFLDCSKIAAGLLVAAFEQHGIKNYGIKFSVCGGTPILIKEKNKISLIPIRKAINLLKDGLSLEVLSLSKKNKVAFSKIYDYLEHDEEIYEIIHDQSKIPLKTTKHHSVFVFDEYGIKERKVSELKISDFLVTFNSKINPLVCKNLEIVNKFRFGKNQHSVNIVERKIKITKELLRLLGYYLAEGHITKVINQVGFSFNRNETEYIGDCIKLLENVTNKKVSIRHPNSGSTQILIHSKEWASFFENFCGKKKNKHIPDFSWTLPKELFLEMLIGYIRGDGYKIGEYTIVVKSVALSLIKELIWLCKLNGISCSLSCEKNKPHKLPQGNEFKGSFVYMLKIPKSELGIEEFSRGRNKFSPLPRDRTFPVSGLKKVYNQVRPKMFNYYRPEQMTLSKERASLRRIKKVIDWFKESNEEKPNMDSEKIIKNYEGLLNSDVGVVKIKSIKKVGMEKVYDLSVENTESFFGNDYPILLHNSGSKGFHLIVSGKAFPEEFGGEKTKNMFPEWPRAICSYLMNYIRKDYNRKAGEILDVGEIEKRTKLKKEDLEGVHCLRCGRRAKKGEVVRLKCPICRMEINRKNMKITKRRLKCLNSDCAGILEVVDGKEYYYCDYCMEDKLPFSSDKYPENFEEVKGISAEKIANLDLVLVAPRHLFRMPYSLHEKTTLASVVLNKEEIHDFSPKDARPLIVKIKEYYPENFEGEGRRLLGEALEWKKNQEGQEEEVQKKKYSSEISIDVSNVTEEMFPKPINKLLKGGLEDGRKRGLFILITFLRSLNFSPDYISNRIREWNNLNVPPLKEGYVRSQIDWHLRQKKKILPPNYDNESFYKDLGLIDSSTSSGGGKPKAKNPIVEVLRKVRSY